MINEKSPLEEGKKLPKFSMQSTDGAHVSLADLAGKKIVLFFYPADNTPTCTKEACAFRDDFSALLSAGALIFGVSPDNLKSHHKFKTKYKLPYDLLVDTDHACAAALGLWVKKSMFGIKFWGVERTTIVIDSAGVVAKIFRKVRVKGHLAAVLEAVRAAK